MKITRVGQRRRRSGVPAAAALAAGLCGAVITTLPATGSAPSATAAKDPCVASEIARTVGKAVTATGDYLDAHPETNQVVTGALQQQPGPQTLANLKSYFDANPKVGDDLAEITAPVTTVGTECKLEVNLPQLLGLLQAAQAQAGAVTQPVLVR